MTSIVVPASSLTSHSSSLSARLLDPGFALTLRPMRYPQFYEMYRDAIRNTWTVEEIDFGIDLNDLRHKLSAADRHLIERLVAFFATGDSIVANNLVLNLYQHINAPEARMYLSRQLYEEALHVQFYLTLLDAYIPDPARRAEAFAAIDNIPSIKAKAAFCFKWMDSVQGLQRLETREQRRAFLLNLICFACCIEGLFFFAAFAYVWFLRSRGLLPGLAAGTNWVFRDESGHMAFALEVIHTVRSEDPGLFDAGMERDVRAMLREAIEVEAAFRRRRAVGRQSDRPVAARDAPVPGIRRRPAPVRARAGTGIRGEEPIPVHGPAGRAGADQLLRTPRLGVPGRHQRCGRIR